MHVGGDRTFLRYVWCVSSAGRQLVNDNHTDVSKFRPAGLTRCRRKTLIGRPLTMLDTQLAVGWSASTPVETTHGVSSSGALWQVEVASRLLIGTVAPGGTTASRASSTAPSQPRRVSMCTFALALPPLKIATLLRALFRPRSVPRWRAGVLGGCSAVRTGMTIRP